MDIERENVMTSIKILKQNFKKHNHSRSWASNIIDASKHLSTRAEWCHFYHYLANPHNYSFDCVVIGEEYLEEKPDLTQDPRFKTIIYKNGKEAVIHLKNQDYPEESDEKTQESDEKTEEEEKTQEV